MEAILHDEKIGFKNLEVQKKLEERKSTDEFGGKKERRVIRGTFLRKILFNA